ncbi:MAG: efflux RND transporter periplasmic adaptor subunit [Candidatus Kapaibacterium sp.]
MIKTRGNYGDGRGRTARSVVAVAFSIILSLALRGWLSAHGGVDDEPPSPTHPSPTTGAGIAVPKEQQFALGMLTEPVSNHDLSQSVTITGRVVPRTDAIADVVSPVAGRIVAGQIPRLGEKVSRGQILFRVAQVLAPSERTGLRTEQIRAKAELASAEREVSRLERLEGVVAGKQIVEANIRRDAARDSYNALTAQLNGAGATVAVTAPISGVITKAEIAGGETVDGSRSLYTIADLSNVWVEANLFEGDIPRIKGATNAAITTPSYPGEIFTGTLYRVGSTVDPTSRTISVLFLTRNPDERLKLDMSASVAVETGESQSMLAVRQSAIVKSGVRTVVFVHTAPERFEARDVVLGSGSGGNYVEVKSGIAVDDRVLTSGGYELKSLAGL